jgi:hypothetical protein
MMLGRLGISLQETVLAYSPRSFIFLLDFFERTIKLLIKRCLGMIGREEIVGHFQSSS